MYKIVKIMCAELVTVGKHTLGVNNGITLVVPAMAVEIDIRFTNEEAQLVAGIAPAKLVDTLLHTSFHSKRNDSTRGLITVSCNPFDNTNPLTEHLLVRLVKTACDQVARNIQRFRTDK